MIGVDHVQNRFDYWRQGVACGFCLPCGFFYVALRKGLTMRNHTQHYYDLNPKPTAWALIRSGLVYVASLVWACLVVYVLTVFLFSF